MRNKMADDVNNIVARNGTIAFTLPISCQICLGKVKQPLLCPNNHVFCGSCLVVWLERNQQCPACRTPIDADHPCKQILGGLNASTELADEQFTNPELRKARFDVLFKEYETEFRKLQTQAELVKAENSVLRQRVKLPDASATQRNVTTEEMDGLAILTRKLNEATKLYNKIKTDMDSLKKDNSELKEQNIDLTRENERLKSEIVGRSPYKYGRYTVATMQTKLDALEKEVGQLNRALEKSDSVIEQLEKELDTYKKNSQGQVNGTGNYGKGDNDRLSGRLECNGFTHQAVEKMGDHKNGENEMDIRKEGLRSAVGRDLKTDDVNFSNKSMLRERSMGVSYNLGSTTAVTNNKIDNITSGYKSSDDILERHRNILMNGVNDGVKPSANKGKVSEPHRKKLFNDDDSLNKGMRSAVNSNVNLGAMSDNGSVKTDLLDTPTKKKVGILMNKTVDSPNKSNKRVKFSVPVMVQQNEVSCSFDLEGPSPLAAGGKNIVLAELSRLDDDIIKRAMEKVTARELNFSMETDSRDNSGVYDEYVVETGNKARGSARGYQNTESLKQSAYTSQGINRSNDSLELSGLEAPTTANADDELNETFTIQNELDELNISVTPEFRDCVKLMHRAEKKVHDEQYGVPDRETAGKLGLASSRTSVFSGIYHSTGGRSSGIDHTTGADNLMILRPPSVVPPELLSTADYSSKLGRDHDILTTSGIVFSRFNAQTYPYQTSTNGISTPYPTTSISSDRKSPHFDIPTKNTTSYPVSYPMSSYLTYNSNTSLPYGTTRFQEPLFRSNSLNQLSHQTGSLMSSQCQTSSAISGLSLAAPTKPYTNAKPPSSSVANLSNSNSLNSYSYKSLPSSIPYSTNTNMSGRHLTYSDEYLSTVTNPCLGTDKSNASLFNPSANKPPLPTTTISGIRNSSVSIPGISTTAYLPSNYTTSSILAQYASKTTTFPGQSSVSLGSGQSGIPTTSITGQFSTSTKYSSTFPYTSNSFTTASDNFPKTQQSSTSASLLSQYNTAPSKPGIVLPGSTNDYSYVSNASSQFDESFLAEPKKRLFDGEMDESLSSLSPMKVTKTSR